MSTLVTCLVVSRIAFEKLRVIRFLGLCSELLFSVCEVVRSSLCPQCSEISVMCLGVGLSRFIIGELF